MEPPRDLVGGPALVAQTLVAMDLGTGRVDHDFDVTEDCPLARVELELEVESMPDGTVTLRSPSGHVQRSSLRVITTTHFVRTWEWRQLEGLHVARGEPAAGTWSLSVRAAGAYYQGGAQPVGAPMPTPHFPRAELRLLCEPTAEPAAPGSSFDVRAEATPRPVRPGGHARVLVPVAQACTVAALTVGVRERWRGEIGAPLVLVTPAGREIPLVAGAPMPLGPRTTFSRDVVAAHGLSSLGVWEVVRVRGATNVEMEEATLQIDCASP